MSRQNTRTILAVDSDQRTRTLLEITLNADGYRAYVVGDPNAAFELLELCPEIVLFDDVTFGPTVTDFVAHARATEPHPDLISMSTRKDTAVIARGLGVRASIVKPFDPTRLFELVTQCPRYTPNGTQIAPAVRAPLPSSAKQKRGNGRSTRHAGH
jgi:DNA-binding NtrC family response regulator